MTQQIHARTWDEVPVNGEPTPEQRLRHDIRQSLGLIMALAAGVQQNLTHLPEVLGHLQQMEHEAERMAELVSAQARATQGAQRVDVGEVVADMWRSAVAAAPCNMHLVCEAATHAVVDPQSLARSVQNLLDNAVRAAGADGLVVVSVLNDGVSVSVTVSDSGPGFGKVPSQQCLGLVTVRRFAAECGGSLEVVTPPRGGATLVLRVPADDRAVGEMTCAS